jgi:hypothetical protein
MEVEISHLYFGNCCVTQVCFFIPLRSPLVWCHWLLPIILATQEADVRKIAFQSQPRQLVYKTLAQKTPSKQQKGWWSGSRCRP